MLVGHAVVQWRGQRLATGLRTWRAAAAMTKQRLHSITLAGLQRKTAAWRSWQALAEERAAVLTLVQHALEAWTRSTLDAGWCTWLAAAAETKERLHALIATLLRHAPPRWAQPLLHSVLANLCLALEGTLQLPERRFTRADLPLLQADVARLGAFFEADIRDLDGVGIGRP